MDGMSFGRRGWRPDESDGGGVLADMGRHTLGAMVVFAVIVVATLGAIVALDRLGISLPVSDLSTGP